LAQGGEWAKDRTRLTVSCTREVVAERLPMATLPPGRYACITLRDDSLGMDATKLASVFDPSLSPAKSDGLTMAQAHGMVRYWGGDIGFSSELQRGSTFSIFLPMASGDGVSAAPAPMAAPIPELIPEPEPLKETILVVDDEAGIRGLMRKILRRDNYNVLEAGSAEEALKLAAGHTGPIQLLLTDVMLPEMQGPELARKLYAVDPTLKVLYISGYTPDESVRAGEYPPGARFLAKPFTLGALLSNVRETLNSPN
jgi:two-component system, cell cycle sensor histidine kinase and response regulator CckA